MLDPVEPPVGAAHRPTPYPQDEPSTSPSPQVEAASRHGERISTCCARDVSPGPADAAGWETTRETSRSPPSGSFIRGRHARSTPAAPVKGRDGSAARSIAQHTCGDVLASESVSEELHLLHRTTAGAVRNARGLDNVASHDDEVLLADGDTVTTVRTGTGDDNPWHAKTACGRRNAVPATVVRDCTDAHAGSLSDLAVDDLADKIAVGRQARPATGSTSVDRRASVELAGCIAWQWLKAHALKLRSSLLLRSLGSLIARPWGSRTPLQIVALERIADRSWRRTKTLGQLAQREDVLELDQFRPPGTMF